MINHVTARHDRTHRQRERRSDGEGDSRHRGRPARIGQVLGVEAQLVAQVGTERVMFVELLGDLPGEVPLDPTLHVDLSELTELRVREMIDLGGFAFQVGSLAVALGRDRHVLAGRHRQGSGDEAGHPASEHRTTTGAAAGDADHETRHRHDAVVGAEHGGTEPGATMHPVGLGTVQPG